MHMRTIFLLTTIAAGILHAQDTTAGRNLWRTSVTALAVANTLDIHSFLGKYELTGPSRARSTSSAARAYSLSSASRVPCWASNTWLTGAVPAVSCIARSR